MVESKIHKKIRGGKSPEFQPIFNNVVESV